MAYKSTKDYLKKDSYNFVHTKLWTKSLTQREYVKNHIINFQKENIVSYSHQREFKNVLNDFNMISKCQSNYECKYNAFNNLIHRYHNLLSNKSFFNYIHKEL